jgi:hypothetical protein
MENILKIDIKKQVEISKLQHKLLRQNPELTPMEALQLARQYYIDSNKS